MILGDETINAVLAEWICSASTMDVWYWDPVTNKVRETRITDATGIHKRTGEVMTAMAHGMMGGGIGQFVTYFKSREDLINSFDPQI